MTIGVIWAQTPSGVIGSDGNMPWRVPEDMTYFREMTSGYPVIMGRRTWLSFPAKFRPLPDRTNIVLTSDSEWAATPEAAGSQAVSSLDEALALARDAPGSEKIWVIGGGQVYEQTLELAEVASITIIDSQVAGDTFAPQLAGSWTLDRMDPASGWHQSTKGERYRFTIWRRQKS
ncbi:dihydrofolate reductase [Renibacterium salmoninarum ATCC 33209]|uniref:Dihydrofolate reductase n=1 Tax=Renibacterium salmoninarum (strain ATCC 33209 / DSM 20767 / JCM 11484 / NBRC 15589 / NCIMB 2235) TaxID=288705 RepID=A9WNH1_RENSM|nr:dihydrofolate reductase [Renibacterium salmoninarum]ABY22698.1 dihydrofolate reductase [Renibacterium salmoninarum ATCC 33209]